MDFKVLALVWPFEPNEAPNLATCNLNSIRNPGYKPIGLFWADLRDLQEMNILNWYLTKKKKKLNRLKQHTVVPNGP